MKEPIEFTDRERFVISYYRDSKLSGGKWHLFYDGVFLVVSFSCIGLYLRYEDAAWGFVGYGILVWRVTRSWWQGHFYAEAFRSIFSKYDAKLRELTESRSGEEKKT